MTCGFFLLFCLLTTSTFGFDEILATWSKSSLNLVNPDPGYQFFRQPTTGLPALLVTEIGTDELLLIQCTDLDCAETPSQVSLGLNKIIGYHILVDQLPNFIFFNSSGSYFQRCKTQSCSSLSNEVLLSPTEFVLDFLNSSVVRPNIVMGDGNVLRYIECTDVDCTTINNNTLADTSFEVEAVLTDTGSHLFLYDPGTSRVLSQVCANPACSSLTSNYSLNVGEDIQLLRAINGKDDRITLVVWSGTPTSLDVYRCQNAECSSTSSKKQITSSVAEFSLSSSLLGYPIIAWVDFVDEIHIVFCNNSYCTVGSESIVETTITGPTAIHSLLAGYLAKGSHADVDVVYFDFIGTTVTIASLQCQEEYVFRHSTCQEPEPVAPPYVLPNAAIVVIVCIILVTLSLLIAYLVLERRSRS